MMSPKAPEPGSVLGGDFTIVRPLSSGGMGAVFVAEQASTGKLRAVKLMHKELVADPKQLERFEQEARVGARIPSDHVVQVIAAGVDPATGAPWMAMELLEGQDLSAHLDARGALPPGEVLAIFRQLCHALGAAHRAGIVHRDVKPENIFLAKTRSAAEEVSVKVLDFGIAKVVAESKTAVTAAIGTPLWMAPEQSDPRAPITPAADVWSLGLIAFTALTGLSYWRAASDPHAAMTALMREILFEPIQRASIRAAELGRPGLIPAGFDAWFARCVHRELGQRFPTAVEAFDAFPAALSGAPVEVVFPPGGAAQPFGGRGAGFADLPTDAYLATMQGSTTGAPVMSTPAAGAGTNPSGDRSNRIAMDATAPAPSVQASHGSRRAPLLAGIAGALVSIVAGVIFFSTQRPAADSGDDNDTAQRADPPKTEGIKPADPSQGMKTDPAAPGRSPAGAPIPASSRPLAGSPEGGGAKPKSSGSPAGTTSAAAPRPFDHAAAAKSVQQVSGMAKLTCKGKDGPKVVSSTIYFNPSGAVQRVMGDPMVAGKPSVLCANMVLGTARVPAFDGSVQTYPAVVALE
jgi:serine/threonine-protein kinase